MFSSAIVIDVIVHCHTAGALVESNGRKQLSLSSCGWVLIRSGQNKITTTTTTTTIIQSGSSVLTGEEPPPHSGDLKHALTQAGGPTQSQLSRPMSSRHLISTEHRLQRKHLLLNPDTNVEKKTNKENFFVKKKKKQRIRKRKRRRTISKKKKKKKDEEKGDRKKIK